tara:strand:- start:5065 stop:5388 length:324 start_codon:yes stop_codon:yes gene_type:complete
MRGVHRLLKRYVETHGLEEMRELSTKFQCWSLEKRWGCLAELDNGAEEKEEVVVVEEKKVSRKRKSCHQCQCGSYDVEHSQMQTRGADESMTSFYFCHDCESRWKED